MSGNDDIEELRRQIATLDRARKDLEELALAQANTIAMHNSIINLFEDAICSLIFHQPPSVKKDLLDSLKATIADLDRELGSRERSERENEGMRNVEKGIRFAAKHTKIGLIREQFARGIELHRMLGGIK